MDPHGIYSSPSYAMGADNLVNAPQARQAHDELRGMKRSLRSWLGYRRKNDAVAAGQATKLRTPALKTPGARPPAPGIMAQRLRRQRAASEQELAEHLHMLLSEIFDASDLPTPDVAKDPDVAVDLAEIAVTGVLPGEMGSPSAQGLLWLWPIAIVVGGVAFVVATAIRSQADLAKERERLECVKAGKCTDTGFWLKIGGMAVVGWIVWDKMGVGERVARALGGKKR